MDYREIEFKVREPSIRNGFYSMCTCENQLDLYTSQAVRNDWQHSNSTFRLFVDHSKSTDCKLVDKHF